MRFPGTEATRDDQQYLHLLEGVEVNPVFILGFNRSGTTVLHHALFRTGLFHAVNVFHIVYRECLLHLHQHPAEESAVRTRLCQWFRENGLVDRKFDAIPVSPDLPEEYDYALESLRLRPRVTPGNVDGFRRFLAKIRYIAGAERPVILKNPWDTDNFLTLRRLFPRARFVFIHRDPLAALSSHIRLNEALVRECSPYDMLIDRGYRRACRNPLLRSFMRTVFSPSLPVLYQRLRANLVGCCDYVVDRIDELGDRAISLTYPQFCAAPVDCVRRILDFCGLRSAGCEVPVEIQVRAQPLHPRVERAKDEILDQTRRYRERFGV